MDTEDRDHFKTMGSQLAQRQIDSLRRRHEGSSPSLPDRASFLLAAKAIFGCYRRDEAHDPEGFVVALTAVLSDYPWSVVAYASDPRTGISTEYPMGLPNVGQIKQFCDAVAKRQEGLTKPARRAVRYEPPPILPGQETYPQFLARCERDGLVPRPIGRFEQGDEPKAERSGQTQKEKEQITKILQAANEVFWHEELRRKEFRNEGED